MTNASDFFEDLHALRERYPMCYLEAWTPDDWQHILEGEPLFSHVQPSADWDEGIHKQIAHELTGQADAEQGTSWASVREAVLDAQRTRV